MRIIVTLEGEGRLSLPVHYNHIVQGFIYAQLEPNLARWLHGDAYTHAKRTYKMMTFSRLTGPYTLDKKTKRITFTDTVSFQLASLNHDVLASFAEHLLKSQHLRLGQSDVEVVSVEILKRPEVDFSQPARVRALSPITVHSTFEKPGGGKLTYYYAPHERAWSDMLVQNLMRKAGALGWDDPAEALRCASIRPLKANSKDKKVVKYKNFVIEGWLGLYEVRVPEAYFWLLYNVGVGGRNAQGMGMVEVK